MNYIFCDIDGVLNNETCSHIDESNLIQLKALVDETKAFLVINSSASFISSMYKDRIEFIQSKGIKIDDQIVRTSPSYSKAVEVLCYLSKIKEPIDSIVILDDSDSDYSTYLKDYFVRIDPKVGLSSEDN